MTRREKRKITSGLFFGLTIGSLIGLVISASTGWAFYMPTKGTRAVEPRLADNRDFLWFLAILATLSFFVGYILRLMEKKSRTSPPQDNALDHA